MNTKPHKFAPSKPPAPEDIYAPGSAGDYGCVRCGAWTTCVISAERANEKLGPCPAAPASEEPT